MLGKLTTHVLDTANGQPAAGMKIDLIDLLPDRLVNTFVTNRDGRTSSALLSSGRFLSGIYELRFYVADYFRGQGMALPEPAFLDIVPVRFGIADVNANYHVPLLVSPWAYSTYRGS